MEVIEIVCLPGNAFLVNDCVVFAGSASEAVQLYEDLLKCSRTN